MSRVIRWRSGGTLEFPELVDEEDRLIGASPPPPQPRPMISPECRDEVHDECSLGTGNCDCWYHGELR